MDAESALGIEKKISDKKIFIMLRSRLGSVPLRSIRWNSTKPSPEELQRQKEEAAKLAMQSIKDIGGMFSSGEADSETAPIDSAPIYEDPSKFGSLSLLHQGQILQELQKKFDGKWIKLAKKEKELAYYIYYGNWGPREKFDNWNKEETPYDLPFTSRVTKDKANIKSGDKVVKLPPLYLSETPIRKPQFDTKKMDPVTKVFIYLTLFIACIALYRDKKIGEEGKPKELIVRDLHEEQRQQRLREEEEEQKRILELQKQKKWYYLWLR